MTGNSHVFGGMLRRSQIAIAAAEYNTYTLEQSSLTTNSHLCIGFTVLMCMYERL